MGGEIFAVATVRTDALVGDRWDPGPCNEQDPGRTTSGWTVRHLLAARDLKLHEQRST
jgi:hypothetical protein